MTETPLSPYGPSLWQTLSEPLDSLRLLGRRSLLALLGITVGCASVVALLNIGHNAANEAVSTFKGLGSEMMIASFTASAKSRGGGGPATLDVSALTAAVPAIRYAAPLILSAADIGLHGHAHNTVVVGTTAGLAAVLNLSIARGRFLTRYDHQSTYAVIGAKVAAELSSPGQPVKLGSRIRLGGYLFEIVGIMAEKSRNPLIPIPIDDAILLPIEGMRRIIPAPEISSIVALGSRPETLRNTAETLRDYLMSLTPGHNVDVQVLQQLLDGLARQSRTFSWMLVGLGGISLLVGGVGVMNVMVMNVSERRREIGVRMALGARPTDIGLLFLLEAVVLAVAGALAGTILGLAAAWIFVKISGWTFSCFLLSLPLGIVSSLVVGVFFGLQPAITAARLEPVQALRDD